MRTCLKINSALLPLLSVMILIVSCKQEKDSMVLLMYDRESPQIRFAADEIVRSLKAKYHSVVIESLDTPGREVDGNTIIIGELSDTALITSETGGELGWSAPAEEGFSLRVQKKGSGTAIYIVGGDKAGAMYGGLELAEQINIYGLDQVEEMTKNPYMKMRGTKFNIPLDVRTPSYSDPSDAAQRNIEEMWSLEFWKEYLDNLARYRYNYVSLWSLHPFPSMVTVPDYPEVALSDVQRSTVHWKEYNSLNGIGFDAPEIIENVEVLKKMTMDEKIEFWKEVMTYGKSRNIDFYVVTWNIFVNGTNGRYGITDDIDNKITRDYFRKSVRQMFITYPDLAGIGLTTGENMHGASFQQKEDWAFDAYARGVMDVAAEQPDREFTFIHRQHQTGATDIADRFRELIEYENIRFLFSYKYAKAHVFSSTVQPFCRDFVEEIEGMKTIWTLRNDDSYYFRWGSPDFVREFIKNIPHEVSEGYYYGSDQWIWGREFLSLDPVTPRQLEVDKHWYNWTIWGRLGYDPAMGNERFMAMLESRFPGISGRELFNAWQEASMVYPVTTGFHWGSLDFQWYIEGCKSHPRASGNETGFHDVDRFITLEPHPGRNFQSIAEHTEMIRQGTVTDLQTPFDVSGQLHTHADRALEIMENMDPGKDKELRGTLADIRAVAYLGKYYAHKIRGAAELDLCRNLGTDPEAHQESAVKELTHAAEFWRLYVETAAGQYKNPLWTNRVGHVNWEEISRWVEQDIRIAKQQQ